MRSFNLGIKMKINETLSNQSISCDECGAEFEVISTNDSFNTISFCPFCGCEVVDEDMFDEDDLEVEDEDI